MSRNGGNRRPTKGQAPTHRVVTTFTMRYKPDQQVLSRVQKHRLTFSLDCARLCPSTRHIIAQYRLIGDINATRK